MNMITTTAIATAAIPTVAPAMPSPESARRTDNKLEKLFRRLELAHARAQELGDQARRLDDDPRKAACKATLSLCWSRELDAVILQRLGWEEEGDDISLNPSALRRLQSLRFKRHDVEDRVTELVAAQDELDALDLELGITAADKRYEDALEVCHRLVDQIKDVPATTLEGLKIKVKALCWCRTNDFGQIDQFEDDCETTDLKLAVSVVSDLLAMNAA
ncbi:hypothetical protein QMZ05_27645 [Bradyrhizobium sp. INPA03-11B]|uniref:hypothetical protein n=1 Tax=Bradyrhizobium sp. INPA03-11B TaxID=418598 RepID=UPI00338F6A58